MTLKEVFNDIWENTPCRSPLKSAQWCWRNTWQRGCILHCLNDGWWWVKDKI